MYPELSRLEFKTQQRILAELEALGIIGRAIAGTGVMAELKGAYPGRTIAIRADMDALKLTDQCGKAYQSQNNGVCHACGHDGHVAMLLGVAKILRDVQAELYGTIRFLFQPGEEDFPGGAKEMLDQGALDGVEAIIGAHLWQTVPSGTIGISYDRLMASPDAFTVRVKGRGGHGSMPHQTVDPILTAAQIIIALNTIVSRSVDPLEQAVVSVCMMKAGDVFNIIPETAVLQGTVRSFDQDIRQRVFKRIEEIVGGICQAAGADYVLDKIMGFPPIINTPRYTAEIARTGADVLGKENVKVIAPVMAGEDFSHYLEKVPGAFFFVGVGNTAKGIIYPQHHPKYDIDETALLNGMEIMAATAMRLTKE
jgi:amidohydrolase